MRVEAKASRPVRRTEPATVTSTARRRAGTRPDSSPKPATTSAPPADARAGAGNESGRRQSAVTPARAIRELADRANGGSETALAHLRRLLDACPQIWEHAGDLARHAELAWLDVVAGADHLMLESARRHIARMKDELLGPNATKMEKLIVDQAVACYLAVQHAETCLAAPGNCSPAQATIRQRRAESAQRRYLGTLKALARLRVTMRQGMAPLTPLRLHTGERLQA
jgi:hypothetical protein